MDDTLMFAAEDEGSAQHQGSWKLMIVDDEPEVDFAELVRDVMGLSLNRRNLLRALLEEVAA